METMNIENKAYELTEDDKNVIDACLRRPAKVWDAIKEIAIQKFDSYLEQLEPTCNTNDRKSEFNSIKQRWDAVKNDKAEKAKYIKTIQFDDDLVRVLMAYAERIGGIHTPSSKEKNPWKMNLQGNIKNWHSNQTMERDTLFKIAVGFGFTIKETQRLIFTVLSDDEQLDFNPRLANEMIYAYAIIHKIPLTAEIICDGQPVQLLSVKKMIKEGQNVYLHRMFGNDYESCYPKLIEICENRLNINIFDSYNMTSCAFWLAFINLKNKGLINAELNSVYNPDKGKSKSVMSCCYDYAIGSDKAAKAPDFKKAQRSKAEFTKMLGLFGTLIIKRRAKLKQLSKNSNVKKSLYEVTADYIKELKNYVNEQPEDSMLLPKVQRTKAEFAKMLSLIGELINKRIAKLCKSPNVSEAEKILYKATADYIEELKIYIEEQPKDSMLLPKVQRTKAEFTKMLGLIEELINRGIAKLYQLLENCEVKKNLYDAMADYIEKLKLYVDNQPEETKLSPLDLIPHLKESGLGKFTGTDFGEMIDNVIIKKLRRYNDIYKGKTVSNKNDVSLNNEEFEYYMLLLDSLNIAFRDLQAVTQRDYLYLSDIYSEMNKILYYPYFDPEGIGMEIYDYEKGKIDNGLSHSFSIKYLGYALEDADYIKDYNYNEFLNGLLNNNTYCYEMYDHKRLSRGKEDLVKHLACEPYIISDSCSDTNGIIPLFCSEAKGESEYKDKYFRKKDGHKEFLDAFYDVEKFRDQFVKKSVPYKRKDILKLVFWSFAYNPEYAQIIDPEDRVLNFKDYFNGLSSDDELNAAIEKTQCAMINENNSLDRLLMLCAGHSDPIGFLEAAYNVYGKSLKRIF